MQTTTLEVRGQFECLDHLGVEKQLLKTPGVIGARANPASESVTVDFDEAMVTPAALRKVVTDCAFRCRGTPVPRHVCEMHSDVVADDPHAHRHGAAHAGIPAAPKQPMRDEVAHEMGHGAGMDMAAMARDMRNRFIVSLVFTIPIFALAPMGMDRPLLAPPAFLGLDLTLFLLASAAILYPAWPFAVAAVRALRNGILNIAVLVLLSVGTGYLFSVGSTFLSEGEQFYEASANSTSSLPARCDLRISPPLAASAAALLRAHPELMEDLQWHTAAVAALLSNIASYEAPTRNVSQKVGKLPQ